MGTRPYSDLWVSAQVFHYWMHPETFRRRCNHRIIFGFRCPQRTRSLHPRRLGQHRAVDHQYHASVRWFPFRDLRPNLSWHGHRRASPRLVPKLSSPTSLSPHLSNIFMPSSTSSSCRIRHLRAHCHRSVLHIRPVQAHVIQSRRHATERLCRSALRLGL